jgi:hypothetical protein
MNSLQLIFLLSLFTIGTINQNLPPQNPVIGIYTQTYDESATTTNKSYIAASYVKFI